MLLSFIAKVVSSSTWLSLQGIEGSIQRQIHFFDVRRHFSLSIPSLLVSTNKSPASFCSPIKVSGALGKPIIPLRYKNDDNFHDVFNSIYAPKRLKEIYTIKINLQILSVQEGWVMDNG